MKGFCNFYPFLVVDVNTLKNKRFHACALETLRLSATNPERSQVLVSGLHLNALVILFASSEFFKTSGVAAVKYAMIKREKTQVLRKRCTLSFMRFRGTGFFFGKFSIFC